MSEDPQPGANLANRTSGEQMPDSPPSPHPPRTSTSSDAEETGGLAWALRALRSRNYRLFFGGQAISLVGTWMQSVALSWLVYQMTHSAWLLGIVGFSSQIATFLISPFGGVWVDRWDRRRLLIITQSLLMLQAFALATLTLRGVITIWQIVALSTFAGLINGFDMAGRQAFVIEIVGDRKHLSNAIALNSATFNSARLIGPSIAGVAIAAMGEGMVFLINAVSYLAVIAGLMAIRPPGGRARKSNQTGAVQGLLEELTYVANFPPIRSILLLLAMTSLVGTPYTVLMPVFAGKVLGGNAHTLGYLMGAIGVGALSGAIFLAGRKTVLGLGNWIPIAATLFGLGLIGFALSRWLWMSLPILAVTGFGMMVQAASSNTLLQTIVDDEKRGRVMGLYAAAFVGMTPFGSLLAGWVAAKIGAPIAVASGGLLCIAGAVIFSRKLPALRKHVLPIYFAMGILPDLAGISGRREPPDAE